MSLGPAEILVIFVVALLVFGPTRLPEVGRQVGKGMKELKKFQQTLKGDLDDVFKDDANAPGTPTPVPAAPEPAPTLPPKELAEPSPAARAAPDGTSDGPSDATPAVTAADAPDAAPDAPSEGAATPEAHPTTPPA